MRAIRIYVVGLMCVALFGLGFMHAACTKDDKETQMVQKVSEDTVKLTDDAIKNLKIEKIIKADFPQKLTLMGKISVPEDRTVNVPARVTGRTDAIYVASGEVVKEGEP